MGIISSFFPVTVLAALILFIVKETLEYSRRRRGDSRKIAAMKTMIAREIELNNWTIKNIENTLQDIEFGLDQTPPYVFSINVERSGRIIFKRNRGARETASRPIPEVRADVISRHMLDVAMLDRKLFDSLQVAYDAVAELQHVRESLISFILKEDPDFPDFLAGFLNYGRVQLVLIRPPLSSLYRICTGRELTDHRLR